MVPPKLFFGIGAVGGVTVSLIIIIFGKFEIPKELWILFIPFLDAFVVTYNSLLHQKIYTEEKISALLPYENLTLVITIIVAFFLFQDTPLPTFLIAILVVILIFIFSFDFSKWEFPKKFLLILINNSINAGRSLVIGYAFLQLSSPTFFTVRNLLTTLIVWGGIALAGQTVLLCGAKKEFLIPRLIASFLGAISALIGFMLISKFGLVTSMLLGFLSMSSTIVLGYFFLADRPEKKNIILATTIAILVAF